MQWMARRHGGMAAFYEQFTAEMERAGVAAIRAQLAADLHGRILEIGCGTGLNFPHYGPLAEVTAIEPLDEFRTFAAQRATGLEARISVHEGDAEQLPFADHSFDGALGTLVFCSVPNAQRGLQEVRRVVRPGGAVRFFEHVRSERAWAALVQDISNPLWRWLTDGCNLNRDSVGAIRAAGFVIERVQAHEIHVPRAPRFPLREIHARA